MTPAPRIGTEFAGYRIEGLLGRGGMGVVYRAEHPRLGATIALKVMAPELAMDERYRERFVREARLAAGIKHPNIVPIYDAGEWHGDLYIAMRFIEGDDLGALLRVRRVLPFEEACAIGLQVAGALDAAHRNGLVHRDVKPGNILLDDDADPDSQPIAYLADLGLTKRISSENDITSGGELVGTIDYMAPEQISGSPVDGRTDVYSLACVLFECLTGSVPYERETKAAVLWAHLNDEIPRASRLNPALTSAVDEVLSRGMAKDPANRFSSAKELVTELSGSGGAGAHPSAKKNRPPEANQAETLVGSAAPSRRLARSNWKPALAMAVAVVALVGGAVVLTMALDSSPKRASAGPAVGNDTGTQSGAGLTAFDQALVRYIPDRIRPSCRHSEPPDRFDAALVCHPGGAVRSVTYSHATSGTYLYEFMTAQKPRAGLPPSTKRVGLCGAGQIPSINDTIAVGWRGKKEVAEAVGRGSLLGRILCARTSEGARIEWLTQEPAIYAVATGNDIRTLYDWWSTNAGPEP